MRREHFSGEMSGVARLAASEICGMRRVLAAAALIALIICTSARRLSAQTLGQKPAPSTFTLEEAVNYALVHYPAVRAALEQLNASRAGIALARTQYLPQLSGVYQDSRATQNQVDGIWLPTPITPTVEGPIGASSGKSYWGSQAAALFSWEPIDFGLRGARVAEARSAADKSAADLELTRLEVATAVGNYFLAAAANHETVTAAQANVDRWRAFNQSTHTLVENDLRPGADASRADAELSRAKTQLYQAQQAEHAAMDTLASLMGTAGASIKIDAARLLQSQSREEPAEAPPADHPLARDELASLRQTEAEEKTVRRSDYPRLLLQGEGFARGSEVPNGTSILGNWNGLAPDRGNWIAGITILFPDVFSLKARTAQDEISRAQERSQQAEYDKTIQDLTGKIRAARDQLDSARQIAQETPTEVAAARQSETQSRARYQSGLATVVEVAEAENLLAQAEMEDAVARFNVWRSLLQVSYAQGDLQPFLKTLHAVPEGAH